MAQTPRRAPNQPCEVCVSERAYQAAAGIAKTNEELIDALGQCRADVAEASGTAAAANSLTRELRAQLAECNRQREELAARVVTHQVQEAGRTPPVAWMGAGAAISSLVLLGAFYATGNTDARVYLGLSSMTAAGSVLFFVF